MPQLLKENHTGKVLALTLIILSLAAFLPFPAYAHAKLLRSQPADGEVLEQAPRMIELEFSTELQSAEMSTIVVTDENERRVDKNNLVISENRRKLQIELEEIGSGIFTVEWKTLSTDDHTVKGEFKFSVSLPKTGKTPLTAAVEQSRSEGASNAPTIRQLPSQESGMNPVQSIARWLKYLAMMMLFGGFAFLLFVLNPSFRQASDSGDKSTLWSVEAVNQFTRISWFSLGLLVLSAAAGLILQTSAVMDESLAQAISPSNLVEVLTKTSFGFSWLLQITAALALGIILYFLPDKKRIDDPSQLFSHIKTALLWMGFIICALLFLASASSGHALAAVKEYPLAILFDWLHLLAVGIWVGGLFQLVLILPKSFTVLAGKSRAHVLSRAIRLFSRLAVGAAIVIALTGIYNSWIHVDDFSALWNTSYGIVLISKIILFLPMLALGGLNSFVLRPRIKLQAVHDTASADENPNAERNFYRSVRIEAAIGAVVLLLAAILAFLPPARTHEMINNESITIPVLNKTVSK